MFQHNLVAGLKFLIGSVFLSVSAFLCVISAIYWLGSHMEMGATTFTLPFRWIKHQEATWVTIICLYAER